MKGHVTNIILWILSISVGALGVSKISNLVFPTKYNAQIKVKDGGIALVNASINLFNSQSELVCSLTTDNRGQCIFKDLESGTYSYIVQCNGKSYSYNFCVKETTDVIPETCDISLPTKTVDQVITTPPVSPDTTKHIPVNTTSAPSPEKVVINTLNSPVTTNGKTVTDDNNSTTTNIQPQETSMQKQSGSDNGINSTTPSSTNGHQNTNQQNSEPTNVYQQPSHYQQGYSSSSNQSSGYYTTVNGNSQSYGNQQNPQNVNRGQYHSVRRYPHPLYVNYPVRAVYYSNSPIMRPAYSNNAYYRGGGGYGYRGGGGGRRR